jgi:hypothetical protein
MKILPKIILMYMPTNPLAFGPHKGAYAGTLEEI